MAGTTVQEIAPLDEKVNTVLYQSKQTPAASLSADTVLWTGGFSEVDALGAGGPEFKRYILIRKYQNRLFMFLVISLM